MLPRHMYLNYYKGTVPIFIADSSTNSVVKLTVVFLPYFIDVQNLNTVFES